MQNLELEPRNPWRRLIPVGITVMAGAIVLSIEWYFSDKLPANSGAVTAALTVVFGAAVFAIELSSETASQRVIKNVLLSIGISGPPADRHLRSTHSWLLEELANGSKLLCAELRNQDPTKTVGILDRCIDAMGKGKYEEIRALCGNKPYGEPLTDQYFRKNYAKAANDDVKVKRIFLEPRQGFLAPEKKVIEEHMRENNVEARVIRTADARHVRKARAVPAGFGFAVLGDCVVVHWGLKRKSKATEMRNSLIVAAYRTWHEELWNTAFGKDDSEQNKIWTDILGRQLPRP